jgi:hypothetical protein
LKRAQPGEIIAQRHHLVAEKTVLIRQTLILMLKEFENLITHGILLEARPASTLPYGRQRD